MPFQRTGLRTIRDIAHKSCQLIAVFAPVIKRAYPESPALLLALEAASAACAALVDEADAVLPVGD